MSEAKIALWHTNGTNACNEKAFWYEPPLTGELSSEKAELLDGTKPNGGDLMRCGSCGKPIGPRNVSQSKKVD